MDGLDTLVLDQLADRVFQPDRLTDLLKGYLDQSQDAERERRQQLGRLKAELTETEGATRQLLAMVEKGLIDLDDPVLAGRLRHYKANRAKLNDEIALASSRVQRRQDRHYPGKTQSPGGRHARGAEDGTN